MHFLGLAGMPRRIPNYPEAYSDWNHIASIGSSLSVISLIIFFVMVFKLFAFTAPTSKGERCKNAKLAQLGRAKKLIKYLHSESNLSSSIYFDETIASLKSPYDDYYLELYSHYRERKLALLAMRGYMMYKNNKLPSGATVGDFVAVRNCLLSTPLTNLSNSIKDICVGIVWDQVCYVVHDHLSMDGEEKGTSVTTRHS
jgi:heme/copper-type cytochrome/quinol oxidase subunit 1